MAEQINMPYLPNEIWLSVISRCSDENAWLSCRLVNRQLRDCVEQHFIDDVLTRLEVKLPMAMPTYDIRNPVRGEAILRHCKARKAASQAGDLERACFTVSDTEPAHCEIQFLSRWERMREASGGNLSDSLRWNLQLKRVSGWRVADAVRLKEARIDKGCGHHTGGIQLSFEWKPAMTVFCKRFKLPVPSAT